MSRVYSKKFYHYNEGVALEAIMALRELRLGKGLTQAGLGERLGVGQKTVENWERGRSPRLVNAVALVLRACEVLECNPEELISSEDVVGAVTGLDSCSSMLPIMQE